MPRFDYKCTRCGRVVEVVISNYNDATKTHVERCVCGRDMEKQPAAPAFKVNGFNAKNGYAGR